MKKFLAALTVLVTLTVAVPVPNVDGHGENRRFSTSTVYASAENQFVHEHVHRALEECGKKQQRWSGCLLCYGSGRCQNCNGVGHVVIIDPNGFPVNQYCYTCNGSGLCQICGGRGGYYTR